MNYWYLKSLPTPDEALFIKIPNFGLGQTIWADKFWVISGIFDQCISTHFDTVTSLFNVHVFHYSITYILFLQKTQPFHPNPKYLNDLAVFLKNDVFVIMFALICYSLNLDCSLLTFTYLQIDNALWGQTSCMEFVPQGIFYSILQLEKGNWKFWKQNSDLQSWSLIEWRARIAYFLTFWSRLQQNSTRIQKIFLKNCQWSKETFGFSSSYLFW